MRKDMKNRYIIEEQVMMATASAALQIGIYLMNPPKTSWASEAKRPGPMHIKVNCTGKSV
jgi:hypothetical protein